ncbi:MAG: hypothetical protein PVG49_11200 [Desulfobacteraceae bacterium]|jgi:hypothetical protein
MSTSGIDQSRLQEIQETIQAACCNEAGELRAQLDNDAKPFDNLQERDEFFSKYAGFLSEYEMRSSDELRKKLIEKEKDDLEYRIFTASQSLKSLGASKETIASTADALRRDLEKRMKEFMEDGKEGEQENHRIHGDEQIKRVSIEARNMILCDIRVLYLDKSPLKKTLQIAHSMSLAFTSLGLFPNNPETIREILIDNCATDISI